MSQNVTHGPPEGEPSVTHYTRPGDPHTWCGISVHDVTVGQLTQVRAQVTDPACVAQLAAAHIFDGARTAEDEAWAARATAEEATEPAIRYGEYGDRQDEFEALSWLSKYDVIEHCHAVALMSNAALELVEPEPITQPAPERRTVSLEVLTPELRAMLPGTTERDREQRDAARVGVVLRVGGRAMVVPDTDAPWQEIHSAHPLKILRGLISEMITGASRLRYTEDQPVELLMPTPDVLAALAGTPEATFWSAEVGLRADQVMGGWLIVGWASEGDAALVTAIDECADRTCSWHACCTVITAGGAEPVHTPDFSDVTVRIPAAATR